MSQNAGSKHLQCRHFPMTLSPSDIDALRPGEWVTDDVIDFYFNSQHIKDLASDANALDFETQCLKKPRSIRVAFLPIFGDDHWSLLVYRNVKHRPLPEFLHFNSHLGSTRENHTQCARAALINLLYVFRENDALMTISKESYRLVVKNCPQQANGNDCGVFVCMNAYVLSSRLAKREKEGASPLHALVRRLSVSYSPGRKSDALGFAEKNPEKDGDPDELMWKIKDKDAIRPDDMRSYITNVIYSATFTSNTPASL
ncbi:hypothetical protein GGH96_002758 [Coemansia sp. RSA 1972]|nr:hypothetical protein GGH96_002758 [Coemansia sp. RSA 1972]